MLSEWMQVRGTRQVRRLQMSQTGSAEFHDRLCLVAVTKVWEALTAFLSGDGSLERPKT